MTTSSEKFNPADVKRGMLLLGTNGKTYKAQSEAYEDMNGVPRIGVKSWNGERTTGPYRYMRQDSFAEVVR